MQRDGITTFVNCAPMLRLFLVCKLVFFVTDTFWPILVANKLLQAEWASDAAQPWHPAALDIYLGCVGHLICSV